MISCLNPPKHLWQYCQDWGIPCRYDEAALANASVDFGRIVQGRPQTVACPQTPADIVRLFHGANQQGISITPRGGGYSQSGQSINPDGITLDVSSLTAIASDAEQVVCGAATTWRQLVDHLAPQGRLPSVMPLNLDLTIGGTLSAGGFSANSHRYGLSVCNVNALDVVTGNGDALTCSPQEHADVFAVALGGLGQCAVITSATLATRSIKPQVRLYYLLYEDLDQWLDDQQMLATAHRVDYMEGFCAASIQGLHQTPKGRRPLMHWLYGLHVGIEFDPEHPPEQDQVLQGLQYHRLLHVEDDAVVNYAARYDARFQAMKSSGAWQQTHPWFECLLPLDAARELIPKVLHILPPWFGDGHRVMFLAEQNIPHFFMTPSQSPTVAFALLPTGIPQDQLKPTLEVLETVHDWVIQAGGKRYLSGWLGMMTPEDWQCHYGDRYPAFQALKQQLDPNHILRSMLLP